MPRKEEILVAWRRVPFLRSLPDVCKEQLLPLHTEQFCSLHREQICAWHRESSALCKESSQLCTVFRTESRAVVHAASRAGLCAETNSLSSNLSAKNVLFLCKETSSTLCPESRSVHCAVNGTPLFFAQGAALLIGQRTELLSVWRTVLLALHSVLRTILSTAQRAAL